MQRKTKLLAVACLAAAIVVFMVLAWSFSSIEHLASASQSRKFVVDCDFDKFRQIMVRKNATAAIVGQSGMTLLDEQIHDIEIDSSADARPILNAIRGSSKSNVAAVKEITVQLEDPSLDAAELILRQHAEIQPDEMDVVTNSKQLAGNLEHYATTLKAGPGVNGTNVELTVEMDVRVRVPRLFTGRADSEVQNAADDAIDDQAESIAKFIGKHADKRVILPELASSGRSR